MEVQLSRERHAQLTDYAERHGQETAAALDNVLAAALEWEQLDFQEAVSGIREGHEDLQVGRTQSAEKVFQEIRARHGI